MRVYKLGSFDVTRQIFLGRESAGGDSHGPLLPTPDEELIAQLSLVPRLTHYLGGWVCQAKYSHTHTLDVGDSPTAHLNVISSKP